MFSKEIFAKNLRFIREVREVSREDLSAEIGADDDYIMRLESGEELPSLIRFYALCERLNASPRLFFGSEFVGEEEYNEIMNNLDGFTEEEYCLIFDLMMLCLTRRKLYEKKTEKLRKIIEKGCENRGEK